MYQDPIIIPMETSDLVRNTQTPFVQLRANGYSYMSKKAVMLLDFKHGDMIRFNRIGDRGLCISNDPVYGASVRKFSNLYKFCDVNAVRNIFKVFNLDCTRANFPLASEVEEKTDLEGNIIKVLFLIPNPYNIK